MQDFSSAGLIYSKGSSKSASKDKMKTANNTGPHLSLKNKSLIESCHLTEVT